MWNIQLFIVDIHSFSHSLSHPLPSPPSLPPSWTGEAKQRLSTLREEMEVKQEENQLLQSKLLELSSEHETQLSRNQQV